MGPRLRVLLLWGLSLLGAGGRGDDDSLSGMTMEFSATLENNPVNVGDDDGPSSKTIQYKTAEMADAMLGSDFYTDRAVLLSMVPGAPRDTHMTESEEGTCDAIGDGEECSASESITTLDKSAADSQEEKTKVSDNLRETSNGSPAKTDDSNNTECAKTPKVNCEERNITGMENFTLQILNVSQDLMDFLNPNVSECTLVLFYTPWCRFSAGLAPHFNSLPRAFPTIQFLALDASQHSSLSTRFGTVAVPNILLFQGAKPMARFNQTERTLETLKAFIFNQSGIEAKNDVVVTAEDQEGPLPSTSSKGIDWLLVFSLMFVASFFIYATLRTESIRWLLPGPEQEHPE